MNKRIRKRVHIRYLEEVVYTISVSSVWRKKLFETGSGVKFIINSKTLSPKIDKYLHHLLRRYQLNYYVSKILCQEENRGGEYKNNVIFKFEAIEFPEIQEFSFNNPESA